MLTVESKTRPTATQILQMDWLKDAFEKDKIDFETECRGRAAERVESLRPGDTERGY